MGFGPGYLWWPLFSLSQEVFPGNSSREVRNLDREGKEVNKVFIINQLMIIEELSGTLENTLSRGRQCPSILDYHAIGQGGLTT